MRKFLNAFAVFSFVIAGLALAPAPVQAQSGSVGLDCSGSDICNVMSVSSPGSPLPLHYAWSFNSNNTDAIYPANCTDRDGCMFYCPKRPGRIQVSVTVSDANYQFIGSASTMASCTPEPL
ncbi:hypothetical protein [Dyella sp. 20L07]|uniref:hypothetical protein n=1 Tax=Dyella sp. 20L07 TaxID=3384240 RepID=UPI003D2BE28D